MTDEILEQVISEAGTVGRAIAARLSRWLGARPECSLPASSDARTGESVRRTVGH